MSTRRHFLRASMAGSLGFMAGPLMAQAMRPEGENISFGLCTYMLGADWDVPTLLEKLTELRIRGVELRVDHAHKVSPALSPEQRRAIKEQFVGAGIEVIGMGTNARFDSPDEARLLTQMDEARQYIRLSHDIGGSGVKVKPDKLHEKDGIPKEKTLEQISMCLAELGEFAVGFGQEIRLEVHGDVTSLADIQTIMEATAADNVKVCWNSNPQDMVDGGIADQFALVSKHLGRTVHIKEQDGSLYPYDELAKLLVAMDYDGWVLLEAASKVDDAASAIARHRLLWEQRLLAARKA